MSVAASGPVAVGGGCMPSSNPPTVSFPRKRDKPESQRGCFQVVCTYIRSKCEVSASEWHGGACSWCRALPNPSSSGGLLFSQMLALVLGVASAESSPGLLSDERSCGLFQGCVPSMGGDQSVSSDWLVSGYRHLPLCLSAGQF